MIVRLVVAVVIAYGTYRVGIWAIRTVGNPPPPPPPPGELRRIKVHYRCTLCGAEARMTKAATEDPAPPRHCMEEMEFVPIDD